MSDLPTYFKEKARSAEPSLMRSIARIYEARRHSKRWPKRADIQSDFYQAMSTTPAMLAFLEQAEPDPDVSDGVPETVAGKCFVCDLDVDFTVIPEQILQSNNWRETMSCPNCQLINRWRSSVHLYEALVKPEADDRIYMTESITPLYRTMAKRYPNCIGSEYSDEVPLGSEIELPGGKTRIEDVTQLTFPDRSFEAVLSFDVLEHVPDYKKALREFSRVLVPHGLAMISVPSTFGDKTVTRAEVAQDGSIRHLLEPSYHGDPLSDEGVLCYYEFGVELLEEMKKAGFRDAFLVCYTSQRWGYQGSHLMYIGRK